MTNCDFLNIGFIGFGLIGGSIAKAIKASHPEYHIIVESRSREPLIAALNDKVIDDICTCTDDNFSKCDYIFLCTPVITITKYMSALKPFIKPGCIITDVGSVKGNIHKAVAELGLNKNFIGGHPMTGSEKTGYANSDSSYLKDAYYILTPTEEVPAEYTSWLKNFIITAGSHCEIMDYKTHDNVTAAISHCPHIISASLINTVAELDDDGKYGRLAAGGLKDITRISSSSPEMWQNICLSNPDAIVSFLNRYIATLTNAKEAVISGDSDKLMQFFESAKKYRDKL